MTDVVDQHIRQHAGRQLSMMHAVEYIQAPLSRHGRPVYLKILKITSAAEKGVIRRPPCVGSGEHGEEIQRTPRSLSPR